MTTKTRKPKSAPTARQKMDADVAAGRMSEQDRRKLLRRGTYEGAPEVTQPATGADPMAEANARKAFHRGHTGVKSKYTPWATDRNILRGKRRTPGT